MIDVVDWCSMFCDPVQSNILGRPTLSNSERFCRVPLIFFRSGATIWHEALSRHTYVSIFAPRDVAGDKYVAEECVACVYQKWRGWVDFSQIWRTSGLYSPYSQGDISDSPDYVKTCKCLTRSNNRTFFCRKRDVGVVRKCHIIKKIFIQLFTQ